MCLTTNAWEERHINDFLNDIEILAVDSSHYAKNNLQGDVIRVIDSNGECVVKYVYNSQGKVIEVTDAQGNAVTSYTHIGNINPIRNRSYYNWYRSKHSKPRY